MSNTAISIKGYGKLPFLEKNKSDYIEQNIILYGESGSGKTVQIREIMYIVRNDIPNIVIISPTEDSNQSYSGLVPKSCIKEEITVNELKRLYERQVEAKKIYLVANDLSRLGRLFIRCATIREREVFNKIREHFRKKIERYKNEINDIEKQKSIINRLNQAKNDTIKAYYKDIIAKYKKSLLKGDISEEEKLIITYLRFNHRIMIIFDDYSASAQQWGKDETVRKILFQGRHEGITFVIAIHNFSLLNTDIRTNAHLSIFTTSISATRYFSASANGFSKSEKIEAENIANGIWKKEETNNHKKLVYQRNTSDKFKYTIADIQEDFKFGSPYLWKLCQSIEKTGGLSFSGLFSLPG
jgi:Cdc6-like AAA superfamily ATPase